MRRKEGAGGHHRRNRRALVLKQSAQQSAGLEENERHGNQSAPYSATGLHRREKVSSSPVAITSNEIGLIDQRETQREGNEAKHGVLADKKEHKKGQADRCNNQQEARAWFLSRQP